MTVINTSSLHRRYSKEFCRPIIGHLSPLITSLKLMCKDAPSSASDLLQSERHHPHFFRVMVWASSSGPLVLQLHRVPTSTCQLRGLRILIGLRPHSSFFIPILYLSILPFSDACHQSLLRCFLRSPLVGRDLTCSSREGHLAFTFSSYGKSGDSGAAEVGSRLLSLHFSHSSGVLLRS